MASTALLRVILGLVSAMALSMAPTARATEPAMAAIDASATVLAPGLPPPKAGLRDLTLVFGKDPAEAMRTVIERELRDLEAFREFLPSGGEFSLQVNILSIKRSERRLGGVEGESPDMLSVEMETENTWNWGESTQMTIPLNVSRRISVDRQPQRSELESMLRSLLRETGQRAMAELYETHFYKGARRVK